MIDNDIIAVLDMGSSSIKTLIARIEHDTIDIIGIGKAESKGIRKGTIINIEEAADSVSESIEQAELMSGIKVGNIVVSVGGNNISGMNSNGIIGINTKNRKVTEMERQRVLESAMSVHLPSDREIIETIEQEYSLDGVDEIKNPIGMEGTRLEAEIHIITGLKSTTDNTMAALTRHNKKLDVTDMIASVRASSLAVISDDETQLGVTVVDMGHSTTSVIVYLEKTVLHTSVIPIGSMHITNDIAAGLRVTVPTAEELKIDYGYAFADLVHPKEIIEIPSIGQSQNKIIQKRTLAEIIQPRVEEILSYVKRDVQKIECDALISAGTIYTGGGAMLAGIVELSEAFQGGVTSRIGHFSGITGVTDILDDSSFSGAIGLLKMVDDEIRRSAAPMPHSHTTVKKQPQDKQHKSSVRKFFREFFK